MQDLHSALTVAGPCWICTSFPKLLTGESWANLREYRFRRDAVNKESASEEISGGWKSPLSPLFQAEAQLLRSMTVAGS